MSITRSLLVLLLYVGRHCMQVSVVWFLKLHLEPQSYVCLPSTDVQNNIVLHPRQNWVQFFTFIVDPEHK